MSEARKPDNKRRIDFAVLSLSVMIACTLLVTQLGGCGAFRASTDDDGGSNGAILTYGDFLAEGRSVDPTSSTMAEGPDASPSVLDGRPPMDDATAVGGDDAGGAAGRSPSPDSGVGEKVDPPTSQPVSGAESNPVGASIAGDNRGDGAVPDGPRTRRKPLEPGKQVVVDSLVGQINGRSVYANRFFAPIDDKLRVMQESMTPRQFDLALQQEVAERLQQILFSELFLAEAESKLTPQQQQGLIAWLSQRREDIISEKGGASAVANLRLTEEGIEGGIDQYVQNERDRALVQMLLQQEVRPRVIISWRDIQQRYERDFEKYNPPGQATIAWIALTPGKDDAKIEDVKRRLASGESFLDVAKDYAVFGDGILAENIRVGSDGLAGAEGLNELYREQLSGLEQGAIAGPFEQTRQDGGKWLVWLYVAKIQRPERRDLYDPEVQLAIRDELFSEKFLIEQRRFAEELLDQSIQKDLTKLTEDLVRIGSLRYD